MDDLYIRLAKHLESLIMGYMFGLLGAFHWLHYLSIGVISYAFGEHDNC